MAWPSSRTSLRGGVLLHPYVCAPGYDAALKPGWQAYQLLSILCALEALLRNLPGFNAVTSGAQMPFVSCCYGRCNLRVIGERIVIMDRLDEKAEKLRALKFNVTGRGGRPRANTEGLYIDSSFFDEQFVDQLIAGTALEIVLNNRERFIRSL